MNVMRAIDAVLCQLRAQRVRPVLTIGPGLAHSGANGAHARLAAIERQHRCAERLRFRACRVKRLWGVERCD